MKNIVSPSLLSCDFLNIQNEVEFFKQEKNLWFHLDIMDGHFVPNLTFGLPIIKKMPAVTSIPLDAHFMVSNPSFHLDDFKDSGIYNFTFHFEVVNDPLELIARGKKFYPSMGISIKPKTPVSSLSDEVLKNLDLVLIMSVEPGFGGQSFIENTWNKLKELNQRRADLGLSFLIQIDGGVNGDNAKELRDFGADNLVAGSYIFNEGPVQYSNKIQSLR